jgi:glycosyltransferase 2 family protein
LTGAPPLRLLGPLRLKFVSSARNFLKSIFRNWRYAIGWLLAAAGLIWVLHDVHLSRLPGQLAAVDWRWVALAMVCDLLSYLVQGARWQLLLEPVGKIDLLQAMQAIYAGLFTNVVLPMRPGELVRSYIASLWMRAGFVTIIPSIVMERLFDGVWIAMGVGLAATLAPLPENLIKAGETFDAVIALLVVLFIYLVLRRPRPRRSGRPAGRGAPRWKPLRAIAGFFRRLSEGLRAASRTKEFYLAFALSLPFLALQAITLWLIMLGYGLRLSFWVGVAVYVIVGLGTALPNTPANIGSYQFFTVLGLTLFGVDKTSATGFSLVVFTLLSLPPLIIGFLALSRSGLGLAAILEELRRLESRADL